MKTNEMLTILNVTYTVEKALTAMYDAAIDRCDLDDVKDNYARFRDQADRHARAARGLVEDMGGEVQEVVHAFPTTSYLEAFENTDRDGVLGAFYDLLDVWFIQGRAEAQWSVLEHVAETAGHEELLRVVAAAEEETDDAVDWLEDKTEALAEDLVLLEESRIEETQDT